jgi:hypothetical protein
MMTGLVYVAFGPTSFLVGFMVSEACSAISQFIKKEGTHMINKAQEMVRSFVCCTKRAVIASWESRLPYRQRPADELVRSERKGKLRYADV